MTPDTTNTNGIDELPQPEADDHFGTCPECGYHDGHQNVGKSHWFICHRHHTRWNVGSNLFSSWRGETEEQQRHAYEVEPGWGAYDVVEPHHAARPTTTFPWPSGLAFRLPTTDPSEPPF